MMKLTDRIKTRLLRYKADTGQNLKHIHKEMKPFRDTTDFTYQTLRNFANTDINCSGHVLNVIDEYLIERGY